MVGLFWTVMLILSLGLFITGLVKPAVFAPLFGAGFSRKRAGLVFGALLLAVIILGAIFPAEPT